MPDKQISSEGFWRLSMNKLEQIVDLAVNPVDESVLVRIPKGRSLMGNRLDTDNQSHSVDLDEYWIGVYCVTNRQYEKFVAETGFRPPDKTDWGTPAWQNGRCPKEMLDHPVVCVSWNDATAYAEWAGASLPTEAQWEKAARGGKVKLNYPWGSDWDPAKCRNDKNRGAETTAPVWAYPEGCSPYGTFQQSGNVWEWCQDWYGKSHSRRSTYPYTGVIANPRGPERGSRRVLRGGAWYHSDRSLFRTSYRLSRPPEHRSSIIGFRIVKNIA